MELVCTKKYVAFRNGESGSISLTVYKRRWFICKYLEVKCLQNCDIVNDKKAYSAVNIPYDRKSMIYYHMKLCIST